MNINLTSEQRNYVIGKLVGTTWQRQDKFGNACHISFILWQGGKVSRIYINADREKTYIDANDAADLTIGFNNESTGQCVRDLINEQMSLSEAKRQEIREAAQDEARASFDYDM